MKILKLSVLFLSLCLFSACIDTEEVIDINADGSGTYSLSMDMGKIIEMANSMGDKNKSKKPKEKIDTLIYFKNAVAASEQLTAEEKEIFKDGRFRMKLDEAGGEMKIQLSCPFKNMGNLAVVKKELPGMLNKLGLMDKAATKKGGKEDDFSKMSDDKDLAGSVNPSDKYFDFTSAPGKISYSINDKESFKKIMANDSMMQMMQQTSLMMGDMTTTTIIKLPSAVKSVSNPKATLSADKKTVTLKTIVTSVMEKPEEAEYSVEY